MMFLKIRVFKDETISTPTKLYLVLSSLNNRFIYNLLHFCNIESNLIFNFYCLCVTMGNKPLLQATSLEATKDFETGSAKNKKSPITKSVEVKLQEKTCWHQDKLVRVQSSGNGQKADLKHTSQIRENLPSNGEGVGEDYLEY